MTYPTLADYERFADLRTAEQAAALPTPLVSIVTVTFNAAATLERTIASIHAQTFSSIEHVLVDGGSTDATVEIIKRMVRPGDFWVSEKDRGISDAFNRGIALARGKYVLFLNADDWLSPDQIAVAVEQIEYSGADFVYGDLVFYENEKPSFLYRGTADYRPSINRRMPALNHPTVLARRAAFERIGLFGLEWRCAMDYDWFLRLHVDGGIGFYSPKIVGHMTHDGVSNMQYRRTVEEVRRIAIAYGRSAFKSNAEARYRLTKTSLARHVKRWARPLYQLIRSRINKSYDPAIPDGARDSGATRGRAA